MQFDESITIEGNELVLNGLALRTERVLFINHRVFVAALYLENKSQDSQAILESDTPRHLIMHFLHSRIRRRELTDGWKDSFAKLDYEGEKLDQFIDFHSENMRRGERAIYTYLPRKGTIVTIKDEVRGIIPGKEFADALLSTFIGENVELPRIRDALLGKK